MWDFRISYFNNSDTTWGKNKSMGNTCLDNSCNNSAQ